MPDRAPLPVRDPSALAVLAPDRPAPVTRHAGTQFGNLLRSQWQRPGALDSVGGHDRSQSVRASQSENASHPAKCSTSGSVWNTCSRGPTTMSRLLRASA